MTDFAWSARADADAGALSSLSRFHEWWSGRLEAHRFEVRRIPFTELDRWAFEPGTGNLVHDSGRFFTIEGLRLSGDGPATWTQPIINQPEIGILGVLVKEFDGVPHCLMQAKMEPGNVNTLQLSPTVQATRSNFTKVHQGGDTRYLEYFWGTGRGRVLVDSLQSEQGSWFWHKHNRNMVVKVTEDVPEHEDFIWLTLDQVRALLRVENLVNMDTRTVLACFAAARPGEPDAALHSTDEILSWITEMRTRCAWRSRLIPLAEVTGWTREADEIGVGDVDHFSLVAVHVQAATREVVRWTQPLLAPRRTGLAVFLSRWIRGQPHVLVQARPEPGLLGSVEMAPTVQAPSEDGIGTGLSAQTEPYTAYVAAAEPSRVRFDAVLSEEGGRFHHALTRYQIIEVGEEFPLAAPENFRWLSIRQATGLLRHGHYLNVEARSLLACLQSLG